MVGAQGGAVNLPLLSFGRALGPSEQNQRISRPPPHSPLTLWARNACKLGDPCGKNRPARAKALAPVLRKSLFSSE
jgi:hypothetical protein